MKTRIVFLFIFSVYFLVGETNAYAQKNRKTAKQQTNITIEIKEQRVIIDPMIYGQMLEDCNDRVIYGGLINADGSENAKVNELLKPLNMPVVRWPGGTYVHEYDWKKGIGPIAERPVIKEYAWKGLETNLFGTDEFLQWCERMGTEPYINFNMGNDPVFGASLGDALSWIEYVNGPTSTTYGKKRAHNGHEAPYNVKYWGIGNENYGPWGRHSAETAEVYADRLHRWAGTIRTLHPDLQLLGVGHTYKWNETVLQKNGKWIDFLTLHFYMTARVKEGLLEDVTYTLFAPAKVELQIRKSAELLDKTNRQQNRASHPVRFSIDEWNCRHSVFNGETYSFTRNDPRRQLDVIATAGMLNVFIRQSSHVGMANYIFPVNGHGLIRSVGENDAFQSATYPVFELYRKYMTGLLLEAKVDGTKTVLPLNKLAVEGDINEEINTGEVELFYVDVAAVMSTDEQTIHVALINRSHEENQKIKLNVPDGYVPVNMWQLESDDINTANSEENRDLVVCRHIKLSGKQRTFTLSPHGLILLQYVKP